MMSILSPLSLSASILRCSKEGSEIGFRELREAAGKEIYIEREINDGCAQPSDGDGKSLENMSQISANITLTE